MRAAQISRVLSKTIPAGKPVILVGKPGIGKSDVVAQAADQCGADMILSHPSVADPTDYKGLPFAEPGAEYAKFLPYDDLAKLMRAKRLTVAFIDDLGQATSAVQAALMQLVLARQVNGHKIPDCVTFIAATNSREDRAGVTGILDPVKSRFTVLPMEVNTDDWLSWAVMNDVAPEVMAYIRLRPDALLEPSAARDMKNSPCPRTWLDVSDHVKLQHDPSDEMSVFSGNVGEGRAAEFCGFLRMFRDLPSTDEVLLDPKGALMPNEPSALYAISTAMGRVADSSNFNAVLTYAERMPQEYGVLCVRDALRRDKTIAKTKAWMSYVTGPIGKAVAGDVR